MNTTAAFDLLKSSSNARDAKIVLRHIMRSRDAILPDVRLSALQSFKVWNAARKLRLKTPVAKITGHKEFYGLAFETGRATLDPRPESETIIEALQKYFPLDARIKILDCGTGTGCLIGASLRVFPNATGVGIDLSHSAVRCAARNMLKLKLFGRAEIKRRNFGRALPGKFDAIISNPPYVADNDPRVNDCARHDPYVALYAGADGLAAYRALAKSIPEMLNADGKVFLEIGEGQEKEVEKIFSAAGLKHVDSFRDLSGIIRVLVLNKKSPA
ncbi:MAG: peptide chain release factor N(5)-glutamine methyltransferase [Alphaproteobacteria bacterium]|nr:peptide chain release factor N(5)-glutamine methyltransferase [Alphaproteobacteria bacterium]